MFVRLSTAVTAFSALFSVASAQLKVLSPGGSTQWWIADSTNLLVWNCNESQVQNFTVLISNSNANILPSPIAIIAQQQNYVCSLLVTKDQANQPVGTGYSVLLANPLNNTDVYAQSDEFEIKDINSPYPSTTVSPETATSTPAGSASASGSSASGSSSSNTSSNDATSFKISLGYGVAAVGALFGLLAV